MLPRSTHGMLATLLVCALLGVTLASGDPEPPKFVNEEGQKSFESGVEAFDKKEWKEAGDHFKNALRHAEKTSKNKKRVTAWMEASRGGIKLTKLEKATFKAPADMLPGRHWRPAWNKLNKLDRTYGSGPLHENVVALRDRIESHLYLYLATFEAAPGRHERPLPANATYNSDQQYIKRGARSVRWRAQLEHDSYPYFTLAAINGEILKEFPILQFWVYNTTKGKGQYLLCLNSGIQYMGLGGGPPKHSRYRDVSLKKKGWIEVRVDTRKLDDTGIELENVRYIHLVLQRSGKMETIYLDDVRLERP